MQVKERKEGNTYYTIDTDYQLGGQNFATYANEPRGIYIHFAIKEIYGGVEKYELFGNNTFKILYKEVKRNSKKQMELADKWVNENKDALFSLYKKGDKQGLLNLIQGE